MAESQWYLEVNGQKIGPFALDHIQGLYADGEIKGYHQVTSDQLEGQWITVQELVDSLRVAAPPPPTSEFSAPPPPPDGDDEDDVESFDIPLPVLESPGENSESSFAQQLAEEFPAENSFAEEPSAEEPSLEEPLEDPQSEPAVFAPPPPPEAPAEFNSDFQPPPRPPDLRSAVPPPETPKKNSGAATPVLKTLPPMVKEDPIAPVNDPAISMLSSLQLFRERQEKSSDTYDPTLVIQSDLLTGGDNSTSPRMWIIAIIAGVLLGCISWGVLKTLKNKTKAPPGSMTQISNQGTPLPINKAAPPTTANVTTPPNSAFRPADGPRETQHRLAPPRPLVAPSSAPAPVRQFEPPRDQQPPQIDTAQPNEVPPQPQYAPQYQAYPAPNTGAEPNAPQQVVPQQPYVDPNNPTAPPVYPAGNENFQNGAPPQNAVPPQGATPPQTAPGSDNFNGNQPVVPQDQDQLLLQQQLQQQQQQNPQVPVQPTYPNQ